nr:cobalt-precorrin-5B (C(1))-methyltransferase CbiD [uncultured Macellibacteroides sp.]
MILILGGTTEGKEVARILDEAGHPFYYSTKGDKQEVTCKNGIRITGGMNKNQMTGFCLKHEISLLIDAAHPFAELLHQTVSDVAGNMHIPVIRYERVYPPRDPDIIWCSSYDEAIYKLKKHKINKLLALTGVQTIQKLRPYWQEHDCWFRILDREESHLLATAQGFPTEKILCYTPGDDESALLHKLTPNAILTKESGQSGYFVQKAEAARQFGIPVFAITRPILPANFITVTGQLGLRKAMEKAAPGFFPLRSGFTTGTCATAASKAALIALLTGKEQNSSTISLPSGEHISLPITQTDIRKHSATCAVVKDAGDDPDVTNGCTINATVAYSNQSGIQFLTGKGVGIVTLPGLGLEIGGPAINATPRKMITNELTLLYSGGLAVTITVPEGEIIAQRTFNPKLGVIGGISIIGTSGIVKPFSSDAFISSIRKEIEVAKALGIEHLVINSGAKSEKYVKEHYPELPPQAFVHFGNFIGETLAIANELNMPRVTMGIMLGKAVKLAEGYLDTHSKKVTMNKDFLIRAAQQAGCDQETEQQIRNLTLARELWTIPEEEQEKLFPYLLQECYTHCSKLLSNSNLTLLLLSDNGDCKQTLTS